MKADKKIKQFDNELGGFTTVTRHYIHAGMPYGQQNRTQGMRPVGYYDFEVVFNDLGEITSQKEIKRLMYKR